MNEGRVAVVICAAGASVRMGGIKKEYQKLKSCGTSPDSKESTVLGSSVRAFASVPSVEIIVIAIPENTESAAREALAPERLSGQKPKIIFVNGGKTRRASVFNALSFLASHNPCYVLIHDGARPWVSSFLVQNIIEAVKKYGAVIPILPLADTPKECDAPFENKSEDGKELAFSQKPALSQKPAFIKNHLKRARIGIAQTPQGFKFPEILRAHEKAASVEDEEFTDDAEVWGRFCGQVAVIAGSKENRKITFPEDID
jgi:2-C-methyl-D-erythritol 4-phosphate cytidylyltransferase/2-C-methyl-D-erythritol 4-phosphate cytidylyltransferase/2-C-methyl-D-erythritol 2,4-cyclodiphosphate synthase